MKRRPSDACPTVKMFAKKIHKSKSVSGDASKSDEIGERDTETKTDLEEKNEETTPILKPIYYNNHKMSDEVLVNWGCGDRNDCAIHAMSMSMGIDMDRDLFRNAIADSLEATTEENLVNMVYNTRGIPKSGISYQRRLNRMKRYVKRDTFIDVHMLELAWPRISTIFSVPANMGVLICTERPDKLRMCGFLPPRVPEDVIAACLINTQDNTHWMFGTFQGESVSRGFGYLGNNLEDIRSIFEPPRSS